MTFLIPTFLLGMFVCWLLWLQHDRERNRYLLGLELRISQYDSDKQELLNFCEQQRCQIERQQEYETHLAEQLWNAEHPELEEEWPEVVL